MTSQTLIASRHFTIQAVSEGVTAAIAQEGGYAICNAGVIDLGDLTLVFDAFLTPAAGRDLRDAAEALTGRTPKILINSHYHNDHVWGSQVFLPEAVLVSTTQTRSLLQTEGQEEYRHYKENSAERLAALQKQLIEADTQDKRNWLSLWISEYEGVLADLPILTPCYPQLTLDNGGVIYGSRRSAKLIPFENCHTGSDLALYVPEAGVVFMSDLLFVGCHPWLPEGNPQQLLGALRQILKLDADVFVPGHGPMGSRADLELLTAYIEDGLELARQLTAGGAQALEERREYEVPERYRAWRFSGFYTGNVKALCKYVIEQLDQPAS